MGITSIAIDKKTTRTVVADSLLYYFSGDVKALVFNDELHIFGGLVNSATNTDFSAYHYRIDSKSSQLLFVSTLPSNTCAKMVTVINDELHCVDGVSGIHYKLVSNTWTKVDELGSTCKNFNGNMAYYHGKLVLFGIIKNSDNSYTNMMGVWDGNNWTTEVGTCPFKTTPVNACLIEFRDKLYMFGGRVFNATSGTDKVPLNEIYVYSDVDMDSSVTGGVTSSIKKYTSKCKVLKHHLLGTLPIEQAAATVVDNKLHIFGGNWYKDFGSTIDSTRCGLTHYVFDGIKLYRTDDCPYVIIAGASTTMNNNIHLLGGISNATSHQYICNQVETKMSVGNTLNGLDVPGDGFQTVTTNLPAILKLH